MATENYIASGDFGDLGDIELIRLGALLDAASAHERNLDQTSAMDGGRCADAARVACWEIAGRIDRLAANTADGCRVKAKMIDWHNHGAGVFGLAGLLESLT